MNLNKLENRLVVRAGEANNGSMATLYEVFLSSSF